MSKSTLAVVLSGSLLIGVYGPTAYAVDMPGGAAGAAAAESAAGSSAVHEAAKEKAADMAKDKAKETAEEKMHEMAPGADHAKH